MKAYVKNIGLNDNRVNALLSTYHCQFAPIRAERGRRTIFLLSMDTDFLHAAVFRPRFHAAKRTGFLALSDRRDLARRTTFTAKVFRAKRRYLSR